MAMLDPECGYHMWNSIFKSTEGGPPWLAKTEWEKSLVLNVGGVITRQNWLHPSSNSAEGA